ncbi:MAG: hypothetical protein DRN04_16060 [Thermoprotei archaeon]|nr:MAG: hypothetical protein DRN04_16060 [Thermoprotei archaeon]
MKKPAVLLVAVVFLAVLAAQPKNTIVLKAKDYSYIHHIEYIPRPKYVHRALTCSEMAKELLLKSFYGEELDQGLLSFVLKCRKKGYFSETPLSEEFSAEATYYASWLLTRIGLDSGVNASLLYEKLREAEDFETAYYVARALRVLGYSVDKRDLEGFDLGYAVAPLRGSKVPSAEAAALWLLLFPQDSAKKRFLEEKGFKYADWLYVEKLMVLRPIYINCTIYPRIVVEEKPRLVAVKAVKWYCEPVEVSFRALVVNGSLYSVVEAEDRTLVFKHILARQTTAVVEVEERPGRLVLRTAFKPPYILRVRLAGSTYEWNVTAYEFEAEVDSVPGSLILEAEIISRDVYLRGQGEVAVEASVETLLLDYTWLGLPTLTLLTVLAGSRRKRRTALSCLGLSAPLVGCQRLLELHPLVFALAYGGVVLAAAYLADREASRRALSHIFVVSALVATSMILSNPVILLLGGFGAALFLAAAVLYPSELSKTEKLYKSTMIIYSLGILAMALLNETAVSLANFLWIPDEGFVCSVRIQAMFIANLFALTPVVAPIYHLARLIHSYERAKEAEEVLRNLARL